jgi:hypothetical protein
LSLHDVKPQYGPKLGLVRGPGAEGVIQFDLRAVPVVRQEVIRGRLWYPEDPSKSIVGNATVSRGCTETISPIVAYRAILKPNPWKVYGDALILLRCPMTAASLTLSLWRAVHVARLTSASAA